MVAFRTMTAHDDASSRIDKRYQSFHATDKSREKIREKPSTMIPFTDVTE